MHIKLNKNLFWFLKPLKDEEGFSLDLSRPSEFEMGLQQVLSRGRVEDVKKSENSGRISLKIINAVQEHILRIK